MTRTEYLAQLERYLKKLPKEDYDEVMDYFTELFEDAGAEGEAELMDNLGSPKEAAHEVMADLLDKKLSADSKSTSRRQLILLIVLGILAAPVGLPILLIPVMILFVMFMTIMSAIVGLAAVTFGVFALGAHVIWDSLPLFGTSLPAFLLTFGGGLLAIGLACLIFMGIFYVTRWGFKLLIHLGTFFINKMKRGTKK